MQKINVFRILMVVALLLTGFQPNSAQAAYDPCDYPLTWDYDAVSEAGLDTDDYYGTTPPPDILERFCQPIKVDFENFNDGFDKYLNLSISPYPWPSEEYDGGCYSWKCTVNIMCSKKKLSVYLYIGPADSVGWNGSGKIKFDNGGVKTLPYTLFRDLDGVSLRDPKGFMQSLVKAKEGFGIKFRTRDRAVRKDISLLYAKGDLLKYRSVFTKAGCKF